MVTVIKASGERQLFDEQKVLRSIQRAGIPLGLQEKVLNHVKEKLHENIHTSDIYHHITEFLSNSEVPYAKSRYTLKEAIMQLGPSGYPFEDYVARILENYGHKVSVRQIVPGSCIMHEVDVVSLHEKKKYMIEVKFHNNPGTRTEVQVALYTRSRFDDIKKRHGFTTACIVTNTKITSDAVIFAQCTGMEVISWSYPEGNSLRDLIEEKKLHPITALTTLSASNKLALLNNHTVICMDIVKDTSLIDFLPLSKDDKQKVIAEARYLCDVKKDTNIEIK